ncbi:hypothetical protein QJS10_CPA05g00811 [Acorus calamus]|uniref:Uncharacterized protein n=1 Tax=Acorus calamus TaxID=4465 RepID=A0AAV9ESW3_ACOCL|nr:hypothetical protein QJS10_CPA05g00811 [Acorus calamus]
MSRHRRQASQSLPQTFSITGEPDETFNGASHQSFTSDTGHGRGGDTKKASSTTGNGGVHVGFQKKPPPAQLGGSKCSLKE